jgi:hypothetical protein
MKTMTFGKVTLEALELHGEGVKAYRVIQEPLAVGTSLPEPEPVQLTELGVDLRRQIRESRERRMASVASLGDITL